MSAKDALDDWLSDLCCPNDRGVLNRKVSFGKTFLMCSNCQKSFPFQDGILSFVSSDADEISGSVEKAQEMKARDEYAEDYHRHFTPLLNQIEIPPYLKALDPQVDDRVIELGCGTGRITLRYLSKVKSTVALDFSIASLKLLQAQVSESDSSKCLLIQADMSKLPFKDGVFNKAISIQVIEHLPGEPCREEAVREACRVLNNRGKFVCSVYHYSDKKRKDGLPREGHHIQHGMPIYFYHFDVENMKSLLVKGGFRDTRLQGLVMHVRGSRFLGKAMIWVNRALERSRFGFRYAHLIFTVSQKNSSL